MELENFRKIDNFEFINAKDEKFCDIEIALMRIGNKLSRTLNWSQDL